MAEKTVSNLTDDLFILQQATTQDPLRLTDAQVVTLLAHVGDLDPAIRDTTVFTLFARGFKEHVLSPQQRQLIVTPLLTQRWLFTDIDQPRNPAVFLRTFTALLTALILEDDAQTPWLPAPARRQFLHDGLTYLPREHAQRGWTAQGWADGIAHGADLLGAAWTHPHFPATATDQALAALQTVLTRQIRPFKVDEEPRLAMPLVGALRVHHLTDQQLTIWLRTTDELLWRSFDFSDHAALARLHNWISLIHHLYFLLPASETTRAVIVDLGQHYYQQMGYLA